MRWGQTAVAFSERILNQTIFQNKLYQSIQGLTTSSFPPTGSLGGKKKQPGEQNRSY